MSIVIWPEVFTYEKFEYRIGEEQLALADGLQGWHCVCLKIPHLQILAKAW